MFRFKSLKFVDELKRRVSAARTVKVAIVVPPEHVWWGYHEFGTATHLGKDAYPITPHGNYMLKWPDPTNPGKFVEVWYVTAHPGVPPLRLVRDVLDDIRLVVKKQVMSALLRSNYSWDAVQQTLMGSAMPSALDLIVQSIATKMPGSRAEGGKLGGSTAAEVFSSVATIREG